MVTETETKTDPGSGWGVHYPGMLVFLRGGKELRMGWSRERLLSG